MTRLRVCFPAWIWVKSWLLPPLLGGCGTGLEAEAVVSGFEDMTVVSEAVEQGSRHLGIAEHRMMPLSLSGESLKSGSLILTILSMAVAFRSAGVCQGASLI